MFILNHRDSQQSVNIDLSGGGGGGSRKLIISFGISRIYERGCSNFFLEKRLEILI